MVEISSEPRYTENVQEYLQQIQNLLEDFSSLDHSPYLAAHSFADLHSALSNLHPADIAYILEALPLEQRLMVWNQIKSDLDGEILIEVSDAVRESLIATMSHEELIRSTETLDSDQIADLAPDFPQSVIRDVFRHLPFEEREQLREAMSYPEDTVGALMDFDLVTIREDVTLEVVSRYLRRFDELPDPTDQLFVVDRNDRFKGVLPLNRLLVNEPETLVSTLMVAGKIILHPEDRADQAAQAFERYDLVTAPVVDADGKLAGRVAVNSMLDFIRAESDIDLLNQAGLKEEEDLFASVWKSAKNRWMWLALNLCTAFFVSRVIGGFEETIGKFVALAALMPIVAGIAGNSANQTTAIIVRSLALGQITPSNARRLIIKECVIAGLNGLVWGSVAGLFAYLLYDSIPLGLVMTSAMILNLMVGAIVGILIPLGLHRSGRDPAIGSSVMLTAVTDSGGFFIFLGLATLVLIN